MKVTFIRIATVLWAILILVLSVIPGRSLKPFQWDSVIHPDKLGHLFVYAILSFLCVLAYNQTQVLAYSIRKLWIIVLVVALYGLLMELIQSVFFTDRYFEVLDLIANIIGSFIGAFGIHLLKKIKRWMLP